MHLPADTASRHPPILGTRLLHWPDEAACAAFAAALAAALTPGGQAPDARIELHGHLGAGKTTLVRHLLRALGVQGRIKSPTYTVLEPYALPRGGRAAHFDFYRFDDPREWIDAGLRDEFEQPGLVLAEWPEKAGDQLPTPDLRVWITAAEQTGAEAEPAPELAPACDPAAPAVPATPVAPAEPEHRRVTLQALTPAGLALLQALAP